MDAILDRVAGRHLAAALLVARLMLAAIFLHEGLFLAAHRDAAIPSLAKLGVPAPLAIATIGFQVVAGAALAAGWQTRAAALALALFCAATATLFHTGFAVRNELLHFEKDLAMAGGLLLLAVTGGGAWSLDGLSRQTPEGGRQPLSAPER